MFSSTLDGCVVSVSVRHMHNNQRDHPIISSSKWNDDLRAFTNLYNIFRWQQQEQQPQRLKRTQPHIDFVGENNQSRVLGYTVWLCPFAKLPCACRRQAERNQYGTQQHWTATTTKTHKNVGAHWKTTSLYALPLSLCVCVVEFDINEREWRPRARREQHTNTKNTHPHWALLFSHSILFNQIKYTIELLVCYRHSEYRPRSTKPSDRKVVCYQKHIIRMVLQQYKKTISSS